MFTQRELNLIASPQFHDWMERHKARTLKPIEVKLYYIFRKMDEQDRLGDKFDLEKFLTSMT